MNYRSAVVVSLLVLLSAPLAAAPPRPDLAGSKLELLPTVASTCISPRFTGALRLEVRNQGAGAAAASRGQVFEDLDGDGQLSAGDLVHRTFDVPALAPCERLTLDVPLDIPLAFQGSPLHVRLDSASVVSEILETNNLVDALDECRDRGPVDYALLEKWRYEPADTSLCQDHLVTAAAHIAQLTDDNGDGRVDRNDRPDLVFIQETNTPDGAVIRILDGATGSLQSTITTAPYDLELAIDNTPAVADLDRDGRPDIAVQGLFEGAFHTAAFKTDGSLIWVTPTQAPAHLSIADLDGDGELEVISGNQVFDGATGVLRWTSPYAGNSGPIVADLTLDGNKEVLMSGAALRQDGSVLWQHHDPAQPGFVPPYWRQASMAVASVGGASIPRLFAFEVDRNDPERRAWLVAGDTGVVIWGPVVMMSDVKTSGYVATGDLDGDGEPDAVAVHWSSEPPGSRISFAVAVSSEGSVLWTSGPITLAGGDVGVTLFDFGGDGREEVLVRGDEEVFVLDGSTGAILASAPSAHLTQRAISLTGVEQKSAIAPQLQPLTRLPSRPRRRIR